MIISELNLTIQLHNIRVIISKNKKIQLSVLSLFKQQLSSVQWQLMASIWYMHVKKNRQQRSSTVSIILWTGEVASNVTDKKTITPIRI